MLVLAIASGTEQARSQRIPLNGPILLPTLVPLAVALGETPKVGKHYILPVFDPSTMTPKNIGLDVRAESAFVVNDSAVFDSSTMRWHGAQPDTVTRVADRGADRAAASPDGWTSRAASSRRATVDSRWRRLPYEVAFENWRADSTHLVVSDDRDILETTAIAANKRWTSCLSRCACGSPAWISTGFDVKGYRQHLRGDTLTITPRVPDSALAPAYRLADPARRRSANTGPSR